MGGVIIVGTWIVNVDKNEEYFLFTGLKGWNKIRGISIQEHPLAYEQLRSMAIKISSTIDTFNDHDYYERITITWPLADKVYLHTLTHEDFLEYLYSFVHEDHHHFRILFLLFI